MIKTCYLLKEKVEPGFLIAATIWYKYLSLSCIKYYEIINKKDSGKY